VKTPKHVGELLIDISLSRGFFDGASQGPNGFNDVGGLLFISNNQHFNFKVGLDYSSNNCAEMMTFTFLLKIALKKGLAILGFQ
jgi:ribonuclease HI